MEYEVNRGVILSFICSYKLNLKVSEVLLSTFQFWEFIQCMTMVVKHLHFGINVSNHFQNSIVGSGYPCVIVALFRSEQEFTTYSLSSWG